ncbi:long-chain-fatty-acid--CoA ligase [Sphingomonas abietis]|uniref:Long-chain-fatty-acid--CoA ligase n=1 Tax=Sphingomonas abietis TaxID=3012344 RepID=A0ABY7NJZ6_9SPHN|nr:long-chain-fatty-acid--CoA ligase [Sphingomonas abietis]WBO21851.1 long-chain-fatty-acid--CoA ligase [Sphingomonas abietis]
MPLRIAERAPEAHDFPLTIGHLLDAALISSGDQEIVYRDQSRYTYRAFRGRLGRLASLLAGLGAEQGMTIAMMDWDSHRYLEAYFAVPMMGAVLQTVNVRLSPQQVAYTLNHAGAEILVVHHDFFPLVDAILPMLPKVKAVVAIMDGSDGALPAYAKGEYEALSAAASPDFPFVDFDENAVATTFYTTGTTGDPKGVCFTHRQLVLHTLAANAPFGVTRARGLGVDDVYMPLTPMFHVHAWGIPYVATMLGIKQVYPGRYEPKMICDLHQAEGVTFSHCVPTIVQMVIAVADQTGAKLDGWHMIIGGSALTQALWREGRQRRLSLIAGYGMSETAPMIAICHDRPGADGSEEAEMAALTMAGVPVPLVSARIVDADMNPLPHDGQARGELVLRAPWLTPCYTGNPEASEQLWRGGWMHTQDVASIDAQGYIQIRDRLKDVIKTGGEWIDSLTLEDLIAGTPCVAEVAVIGVADARWGERPIAVIAPAAGIVPTLEAINAPLAAAVARGEISRYALLDRIELVDTLPKTSVGKIDKKALRARFAQQPATMPTGKMLSAAV